MINLMFLVQMGMVKAFVDKFPHLIKSLKIENGYDADKPFKLDPIAEKWIMDNMTVNEEILRYGEKETQDNGKVIKLF
jgi:hypothetical protein